MQASTDDIAELTRLEEAMWIAATRFDAAFQQERFAPDFFEFGRSGRIYAREQVILTGSEEIKARFPLDGLQIRLLDGSTAQVTYNSHVRRRRGARQAQLDLDQDGKRLGDALSPGHAL